MSLEPQAGGSAKLLVGPAGMAVSANPDALLFTSPLGACLGVAVYDPATKVGGLMHSLLPDSSLDPQRAAQRPGMFLDTGLAALLSGVRELRAKAENLQVYVAGGAQILDDSSVFDIGKIQADSLTRLLGQLGFEIYAQSLGGRTNCSMELALATGDVRLRYCGESTTTRLCRRSKTT